MKKNVKKNVARKVVDLEQLVKKNFNQIVMEGNDLGNVLIKTISHVLTDYKGFGVVAVGLAKAVTTFESMADLHGLDLESFFDCMYNKLEEGYQEED